jgi:hypothetical protein
MVSGRLLNLRRVSPWLPIDRAIPGILRAARSIAGLWRLKLHCRFYSELTPWLCFVRLGMRRYDDPNRRTIFAGAMNASAGRRHYYRLGSKIRERSLIPDAAKMIHTIIERPCYVRHSS